MNQFITELDSNYELTNYRIKNDVIVMYIKSLKKILLCPYCNTPSNKVHSVYEREIQDLPIQHRKVILLVQTRKMFCTNPACTHTTFSEKHSFAAQKSTKTKRLTEYIIFSSTQISSVNAAKQLKMQGIKICKSSICTLLKKKQFIIDKVSVRAVCIDDFALKKSVSYGTIMVDIDTHRIIDIIPSRGSLEVENWLRSFPNLKVISRDGSKTYASAIQKSHPDIIQISDRFHLIKGLSEVIRKYIIREFPARVEIPLTATISPEMQLLYNIGNRSQRIKFAHQKRKEGLTVNDIALLLHSAPTTIRKYLAIPEEDIPEDKQTTPQKRHELAMQQKKKEVEEARMLSKEGYPIEQIASMMKHTYKTIQNYLDPRYSIVNGHYNVRIPGKLAPYEQEVVELRSQGMTYPKIHAIVSEKGYSGSVASLRSFMKKERTRVREQDEFSKQKEFIPRKSLCQLIYRKIENVPTITKLQYEETLKKYPLLSNLYTLVKEFYEILFSKKAENIKSWIALAQEYDIPELQTFIAGISYDLVAVKNGITYSYNNGLAEGSVNKIKLIKRTMYGRNSFELLKSKVLYHELFQTKFN